MSPLLSSTAPITVSQLTQLLREELEREYRDLWVEGEISNLRLSPAGHYYFTLKDPQAQLKAVFFKGKARYFQRHLREGNHVICHGDLSFYRERGEIQLMVDFLEPRGKGRDFLLLELLKKRLAAESLFAPERKRPLPPLPRTVGIVTSPRGAAIRDIIKVVEETYSRVSLLLYPVTVQGEGASREMVEALEYLNSLGTVDVIILARGGGAKEDLAAFNTEEVTRAVAASSVPVVSAVGHEIDTTLVDLAADARAPTPSAAAHMVVARAVEMERELENLKFRLIKALKTPLNMASLHLDHLTSRLEKARPSAILKAQTLKLLQLEKRLLSAGSQIPARKKEKLQGLHHRLRLQHPMGSLTEKRERLETARRRMVKSIHNILNSKKEALSPLSRALETLSPLAILERGYSITLTMDGVPVTSISQVEVGEDIKVILHEGSLVGTVKGKEK